MTWKKTDLERLKAASLADRLSKSAPPERYAKGAHALSRRKQRDLDRAQGLVPFAVKLHGELVKKLHTHARQRGMPLNDLVANLLEKGLGE
jgi:hypothetical protein